MKKIFKKNLKSIDIKNIIFFFIIIINFLFVQNSKPYQSINENKRLSNKKEVLKIDKKLTPLNTYSISWEQMKSKEKEILWEKISDKEENNLKKLKNDLKNSKFKKTEISVINRSLVFDNERIGPDISWVIPPGFKWNKKYKFDLTTRGHNTSLPHLPEQYGKRKFFGWNKGDAVALLSYQFLHFDKSSFGVNLGVRSLDQSNGGTKIGEGLSGGFRIDYALSETSGLAFGAEQFLHFDEFTDTGRNIYLTASKGWWSDQFDGVGIFPLYVATGGIGTGRLALGNVKGLCSDAFGGNGIDIYKPGRLCWSPVFSLAAVWDENFSTFLEYNSRLFILGNSYAPFENIPARATFGVILSDYDDDFKFHNFSEMSWVFNLSLGF